MMLTAAIFAVVAAGPKTIDLTGAWTATVQFTTGTFSSVKDLEFMLVFNKGGTMTESSNYDGTPPVPPAYGIWRKTGNRQYEAKYVFYQTKAPADFKIIQDGGGWAPMGKGVLIEKIALGPAGRTYTSIIKMKMFDTKGKLLETSSAKATGVRMRF